MHRTPRRRTRESRDHTRLAGRQLQQWPLHAQSVQVRFVQDLRRRQTKRQSKQQQQQQPKQQQQLQVLHSTARHVLQIHGDLQRRRVSVRQRS